MMQQQKNQYLVFHHKVYEQQNGETNELHLLDFVIGVDLLDRFLSFDHRKRPTAAEALGKLLQLIF
jgi:hypothetical protein